MTVKLSFRSQGFDVAWWQQLLWQPIGEHSVLSMNSFVMGLSSVYVTSDLIRS